MLMKLTLPDTMLRHAVELKSHERMNSSIFFADLWHLSSMFGPKQVSPLQQGTRRAVAGSEEEAKSVAAKAAEPHAPNPVPASSSEPAAEVSSQFRPKTDAASSAAPTATKSGSKSQLQPSIDKDSSSEPQGSKLANSGASRQSAGGNTPGRGSKAAKHQSKANQRSSSSSATGVWCFLCCFA